MCDQASGSVTSTVSMWESTSTQGPGPASIVPLTLPTPSISTLIPRCSISAATSLATLRSSPDGLRSPRQPCCEVGQPLLVDLVLFMRSCHSLLLTSASSVRRERLPDDTAAEQRTGRSAVRPHRLAGHEDILYAFRITLRILVSGVVDEPRGIQQNQVGAQTLFDLPSVRQTEAIGRPSRQARHRFFDGNQPVPERVPSQHARGRAVKPGMWVLPEHPVGTDQLQRVPGYGPHRLLGSVVVDRGDIEPGVLEEIHDRHERVTTAPLPYRDERLTDHIAMSRRCVDHDDASGPASLVGVLPAGQSPLDIAPHRLPLRRVLKALQRRGDPTLLSPRGQQSRQHRASGPVGVLVEGDIDLGAGFLEEPEERLYQPRVADDLEV